MKYEQILKLVQSVIDSFTNVAVAHLNGLKAYLSKTVFSVKVTNTATKMKVEGEVKVSNTQPLLKALGGVVFAINGLKKPLMAKKDVVVSNFKDLKFPEFPKEVKVSNPQKEVKITNMKEFTDAVEKIAEFLAKVKYDPRIEVKASDVKIKPPVVNVEAPIVNVPQQPAPIVNVEKPDLSNIKKLMKFFESVNAKNPIAVQLSDGKKYYKALEKMADIYAGSSFSAFQDTSGRDGRAILNRNNEVQVTVSDTWGANDTDEVDANNTYVGEESVTGKWRVKKIVKSGTLTNISYATIRNNSSVADYSEAWIDRATLTYGRAGEAL